MGEGGAGLHSTLVVQVTMAHVVHSTASKEKSKRWTSSPSTNRYPPVHSMAVKWQSLSFLDYSDVGIVYS